MPVVLHGQVAARKETDQPIGGIRLATSSRTGLISAWGAVSVSTISRSACERSEGAGRLGASRWSGINGGVRAMLAG